MYGNLVMTTPYATIAFPNASVTHSNANLLVLPGSNVGIGTTVPLKKLHVEGNTLITGSIEVQGDTITHGDQTTDSDVRLKTGLEKIENALDKVCSLTGYTFNKIGQYKRRTGLLAQEVQNVLPECVITNPDTEFLSVAYGNMMGLIVEAIKDIKQEIDILKKKE
jgi:hypothetical protein